MWHTFLRHKISPRVSNPSSLQKAAYDAVMTRLAPLKTIEGFKLSIVKRITVRDGGNPFPPERLEGQSSTHPHRLSVLPQVSYLTV